MATNTVQKPTDQRALKTFVLWLGWAISSITIFAMMARQSNIIEFVQHDQTRVTWLILAMFLLGIMISFVHTIKLSSEWFSAYRIESQMRHKGLAGVNQTIAGDRLVDHFIQAMTTISARNGRIDVDALIDVEFASQHRLSQFVGFLGNLMITLGLIGTVLGMTITMNGLSGALGSLGVDQTLLVEGLRSAMNGMGIAFYTTLIGSVLGGILLRVFSWITDASVNGLQDLMLRTSIVHASADLEPSDEGNIRVLDASVQHLQGRVELLNMALQASREEMGMLREEAVKMHSELAELAANDPIRTMAAGHARYALSVRPSFMSRLFFRKRS
ncbi:MAG: MotA/TolQ/ExbB proton channel family protein [Mariprofundus sp.]|nr:MotA/TolQ/ExbB proton channel family protein [Mariprofundus sp.]